MTSEDEAKRAAGFAAVDRYVQNGTCIGLGTGSTAYWAVVRVGELVAGGFNVRAVTTSLETERQCIALNVPTVALGDEPIDVAIDGADEATAMRQLLKGGGGALFREKAVALAAETFVAIVTERKLVRVLGSFPLPVEVVPFSLRYVRAAIERYGIAVTPRERDGKPYLSDNGNAILDCAFGRIEDPLRLDAELRAIHGVVATGLFVGITDAIIVACDDGTIREL